MGKQSPKLNMTDDVYSLWRLSPGWGAMAEDIRELSAEHLDELEKYLGAAAKALIVERHFFDKDYRSAFSGFYSKKFVVPPSRSTRLHFFSVPVDWDDVMAADESRPGEGMASRLAAKCGKPSKPGETTPGYLGCISVRAGAPAGYGRTLLDPRRFGAGSFNDHFCLATFRIHLRGQELLIRAFPAQSQDEQVHTCAETSLWCLFRYLSQRYPHYPEIYPFELARLNRDLSTGRTMPSQGMTMEQMAATMGHYGLDAEKYSVNDEDMPRFDQAKNSPFLCRDKSVQDVASQFLHIYTESGMPPIVASHDHAMVVVGCRYSKEMRAGASMKKAVIPATDFVESLIVNDDGFLPYRPLWVSPFERKLGLLSSKRSQEDNDLVTDFVVPLPKDVVMPAEHAENKASETLLRLHGVLNIPPTVSRRRPLVRQLICTSGKNYREWAIGRADPVCSRLLSDLPLPRFLWISSYYDLDDWNGPGREGAAKFEIAIDATASVADDHPYLWGRIESALIVNMSRAFGRTPTMSSEAEDNFVVDRKASRSKRFGSFIRNRSIGSDGNGFQGG